MKKFFICISIIVLLSGCFKKKDINLRLYNIRPDITSSLVKTVNLFNEKNKNITITINDIRNDALNILDANFRSNEAADIVMIPSYTYLQKYAENGDLENLSKTSFAKKIPQSIQSGIITNNTIYGFPLNMNVFGIIYNEAIFERYMVTPPQNRKDLMKLCENLKKNNIFPFDPLVKQKSILNVLFAMGHSSTIDINQFDWIKAMNAGQGSFKTGRIDGFFDSIDGIQKYTTSDNSENTKTSYTNFIEGNTAMIFDNGRFYNRIKKLHPSIRMGIFPLPVSEENDSKLFTDIETVLSINSKIGADKIKAAKKYIEFLATKQCQDILHNEIRFVTPFYTESSSNPDNFHTQIAQYIQANKTVPWSYKLWSPSMFENSRTSMYQYMTGEEDRAGLLQNLDEIWKKFYQIEFK